MNDCIFCKIIGGEIPSKKLYEDEEIIAFDDINPKAPVHFLVVPKKHIGSISEMSDDDEKLIGKVINVGQKIAKEKGLKGWKMLFNVNKEGGQVVFHVHLHILGGGKMDLANT